MNIRTTAGLPQVGRCRDCGEVPKTHAQLTHAFVSLDPVDLGLVNAIYTRCAEPDMRSRFHATPAYRLRQYEDLTDQVAAMITEITALRAQVSDLTASS